MASTALQPAPPLSGVCRTRAAWRASATLLAVVLLCFVNLSTQADPDLWGHLRFGLDILDEAALPAVDTYSYTASGAGWINHEWLAELLFAVSWRAAGPAGLIALKLAIVLLTGALCFGHLKRSGVPFGRAILLLAPAFIVLLPTFGMLRPLLFTIPAFALTLIVLDRAAGGRPGDLWLLPPLFLLWANLHGGFLAGLALVALFSAVRTAAGPRVAGNVLLPAAAAFAATLVNPYGWGLIAFLLRTATTARPEIVEWEPLRATSEYGLMYLAMLGGGIAGLVFSRRGKPAVLMLVIAAAAVLPFAAQRHTALAVIALVVLAGPHLSDVLGRLADRAGSAGRGQEDVPAWAPLLPLGCVVVLAWAATRQPARIIVPAGLYPVRAARIVAASGFEGNLVHRFNWGEYLIWHLAPRVKVMIDGRRETVYSDQLYGRYLKFQTGAGEWDRLLRDHPADAALLEVNSVSANLLRLKPDWAEVYRDDVAVILARRGTSAEVRLRGAAGRDVPLTGTPVFP